MRNIRKNSSRRYTGLAALGFAALVSLAVGVRHSMEFGCRDLQWAGARLLRQHIDPWQEELAHAPNHFAHFSPPNYLHVLYLILLPLGYLSFHAAAMAWTAGDICLSVVCALLLGKLFELDRHQTLVALCVLWMSSPFRVVLEVGQMSFFELFFLSGAYLALSSAIGGLSLGMSLVKYSFSPPAVLLFLFRGRFRLLLFAAIVPAIGLAGASLFLKTPVVRLALEPLAVSSAPTAVSPGFADLMTLVAAGLKSCTTPASALRIAYAAGLLGSGVYAWLLSRFRLSPSEEFTLISLASLFFAKHLVYDYVFLLVLLCFALVQKHWKTKMVLIAGVILFWFILPLAERRTQQDDSIPFHYLAANFILLASILGYSTYLVTFSRRKFERIAALE